MSDFIINNGVLERYTGNGGNVVIPDDVTSIGNSAFSGGLFLTSNGITSITIPDSVTSIGDDAFYNCRELTEITIPNTVASIGCGAFNRCNSLTSITIPDSVTSIEGGSFVSCESLTSITIPDSVTSIGGNAFSSCRSLTNITIPNSVTSIGKQAFYDCRSLTSITIPNSVTSIGEQAFYDCRSLTSITIPGSVTSIGEGLFSDCRKLMRLEVLGDVVFGKHVFGYSLPDGLAGSLDKLYPHLTDGDIKKYYDNKSVFASLSDELKYEIFCSRQSKTLSSWYQEMMDASDINSIANRLAKELSDNPEKNLFSIAGSLMLLFADKVESATLKRLFTIIQNDKKGAATLKKIKADNRLMDILGAAEDESENRNLSPEEQLISKCMSEKKVYQKDLENNLKAFYGLTLKDLPQIVSIDGKPENPLVLLWLLSCHEALISDPWGRKPSVGAEYKKPGICPEAEEVLKYIDSESMQKAMCILSNNLGMTGRSKKMYLAYPICRYADEETMNKLLKRAPIWRSSGSGNDAPPLKSFRDACLYSTHRAVMLFADKYHDLEEYAKIRDTDAQTIRDTALADFGFDAEGKKHYDLGGTTIDVELQKDLTLLLTDCKAGKLVKSIPKRGNDEELVKAASADFAEMKKNLKKVVKNRFTQLFKDFLSGTERDADKWKKAYLENVLLRQVAELVVWAQDDSTFILKDGKAILADGTPYEIGEGAIRVAHPMEMPGEIDAWQKYIMDNRLKQPFEQVWEPVIDSSDVREDRYKGVTFPYYRFLGAGKHGIHVVDEVFHSYIEVSFDGCNADVPVNNGSHYISVNDACTVDRITFRKYSRQVNHIIAYLDKCSIYSRVMNDDAKISQYMHGFTMAQIMDFIRVATENNAVNSAAALLDYKNEHFADVDAMEEFTLDW